MTKVKISINFEWGEYLQIFNSTDVAHITAQIKKIFILKKNSKFP
jgi:hypothetical protein